MIPRRLLLITGVGPPLCATTRFLALPIVFAFAAKNPDFIVPGSGNQEWGAEARPDGKLFVSWSFPFARSSDMMRPDKEGLTILPSVGNVAVAFEPIPFSTTSQPATGDVGTRTDPHHPDCPVGSRYRWQANQTVRRRSQVAKAADCKSATVGSTPTGASLRRQSPKAAGDSLFLTGQSLAPCPLRRSAW